MATIKSFTTLEQSRKLAEILPIESADMEYLAIKEDGKLIGNVPFAKDDYEVEDSAYSHIYDRIACWSLASLLGVLPSGYVIVKNYHSFYYVESRDHERSTNIFNNPVDACVEMIIKLKKLKLL